MAAPESMTTKDLSGTFVLNKSLSDTKEMDQILAHQGVGWVKRTVISNATITLYIKHFTDESHIEHIDIDQKLTGGIETREERTLDWNDRNKEDNLFGHVVGKSRRATLSDLDNDWLKDGWTEETISHGLVEALVRSDTPKSKTVWEGHMTWGFENVGEERRYSRHVYFTGPKAEIVKCKMVYDYKGPV